MDVRLELSIIITHFEGGHIAVPSDDAGRKGHSASQFDSIRTVGSRVRADSPQNYSVVHAEMQLKNWGGRGRGCRHHALTEDGSFLLRAFTTRICHIDVKKSQERARSPSRQM